MAFDTARPENASFRSMQALLFLCHWPLPFERRGDPSHSFIALATHMGLRMGLHRPRFANEFANGNDVTTGENDDGAGDGNGNGEMEVLRRRTWAVCFITNLRYALLVLSRNTFLRVMMLIDATPTASVSAQMGLPATVQLDQSLLDMLAVQPPWLPDCLYQQLHIARHAYNISSTLGYCESSPTGLLPHTTTVIRTFDGDFRLLERQFSSSWATSEYMILLACRMMLYIFAITSESAEKQDAAVDDAAAISIESPSHWLVQCYMVASAIIQTASDSQDQMLLSPARLQRYVINAVCFMLMLKCSRHHALVDQAALNNSISRGWETLQGFSLVTNDFMARACLLIELLSKYSDTLKPEDKTKPFLTVRSRMGANIAISSVRQAEEYYKRTAGEETSLNGGDIMSETFEIDDLNLFADINWDELFPDLTA